MYKKFSVAAAVATSATAL